MSSSSDAIISIKPRFAEAILSGTKTVELRRRIPPIEVGTRLWIYATRPTAAVIGSAVLENVVKKSPADLWKQCGDKTGVDRGTFDSYFEGTTIALGLYLAQVRPASPINIDQLRKTLKGFHPPQVIARLTMADTCSLSGMFCEPSCA